MLQYACPMIPLKLTLQNFLCYRDDNHTLDLSGIRVACLCGNNGHGKSALLDSITWSLWGKARGSGHADLIHYGRSDMWVELEFLAADAHYRVTRRYRSPSGSDLQLQLKGPAGFHPITGNSIRESQAKINSIIGMDYDTFINSAFLIQGRADEFTNKTPAERKEVLGKIIGLDRFNELQRRSRDRARERRERGNFLEGEIEYKRQETAAKPEHQKDLDDVLGSVRSLSEKLEQKNMEAQKLRQEILSLERRTAEAEEIQRRIPQMEGEISQYEADARQRSIRIQGYQDLIDRQSAIEEGFTRYQHSLEESERLNDARARFDELTGYANLLQQGIAQTKARLEEQRLSQKRRLESDLEPVVRKASALEEQLVQSAARIAALDGEEKALSEKKDKLQELSGAEATLRDNQQRLLSEGKEVRGKLDLLDSSHKDTRCPLCDTSLGLDGCLRLEQSYKEAIKEKRSEYRENETVLSKVEAERSRLERQLQSDESTLRRSQREAQRHITIVERQLEDSRRAREEAAKVRQELKQLESTIRNNQFAVVEQAELKTRKAALESLDYSPDRHTELSRRLQELQKYQLLNQQLSEARRSLPQEQEGLAQVRQAVQERGERLSQMGESLSTMDSDQVRLAEVSQQLSRLSADIAGLESRHNNLLARRGQLQGSLQRIEELEGQVDRQTRELRRLREEQAIYEELRVAFGSEGVQALLIDTILPQIEAEANGLLARMTEGRMHLKLESQRPLQSRKGQFAETLEIRVGDELGHRSYEMFSGGEAFRINLALRIALSKVLANRSGAPLPTLFIDEGFGTQDSAGREQIFDVLSTLEQDFRCIIVITHLEELKDYFPVRIEVQKRDGASTAWIS